MPIIDFPFYVDAAAIRATIGGRGAVYGFETVNGVNAANGDLAAVIAGSSNVYGNVAIDGTAYVGALISATSELSGTADYKIGLRAQITSTVAVTALLSYSQGIGYIPSLVSYGADYEATSGSSYLPSLYSEAHSWYVPSRLTEGFGMLLGLTSAGFCGQSTLGEAYLNPLVSAGWLRNALDDPYSAENMVGYGELPVLGSFGRDGERLEVTFDSFLFGLSAFDSQLDLLVVFSSEFGYADVYTARRSLLATYLDSLGFSYDNTCLGVYELAMPEVLGFGSSLTALLNALPGSFTEDSTTWVFNLDNKGSTQYDNFGFNSFAKRGDDYLAAAVDGIYSLGSDSDAGEEISAEVDLATSAFRTPQIKYFPAVYLGVTSTGQLLLKANVDGTDWLFEANNSSANMANQRVDLGRGLRGSHWRFTLLNQNGLDFDLESVEFLPLVSSRRIY